MLSNDALHVIWNLIGPQGRAPINPAELTAVQELRDYVVAEVKKRNEPAAKDAPAS